MGQLLFCSHALAKKPYDIESASLNIYSLEEMSYYLIHNAEFVEMDFVGRTFCDWVRGRTCLQIRRGIRTGGAFL